MNAVQHFRLSGVAVPADTAWMLDEICEHFIEHAEVERDGDLAVLTSEEGVASIRADSGQLLIDLTAPSEHALQMSRTVLAEHLFYFAGEEPFQLNWSEPPPPVTVPNLHAVTVVSAEDVTPRMRRVKFACADITPFINGDMHVRLLVPPPGRSPVWPAYRADGRIGWPQGEDALLVRAYTIRAVDVERSELWIDFLQHPTPGVETPGADFARDVRPGTQLALLGPGSGHLPAAKTIFLGGDESALPAIARIASEVPAGTRLHALIEVWDQSEEQPLPTAGSLDVTWLHRKDYPAGTTGLLADTIKQRLTALDKDIFVWVACEKTDVRAVRGFLKSRAHDRHAMYVAWYWEQDAPGSAGE